MKFRMNCPKCGSTNFSIERDNRSYAPRGQTFEMIFSCRCGKQMFGDQIVKEYERQKKDWEALQEGGASNRPPYDDARSAAGGRSGSSSRDDDDDDDDDDLDMGDDDDDDDDVASSAPPSRSDSRSEARAEPRPEPSPEPSRRRAEEDSPATTAAAHDRAHDHAHDHAHDDNEDGGPGDSEHCGWNGCTNPPRPNSKYCSRDCSNKNARLRYKQRKGTEQEAA